MTQGTVGGSGVRRIIHTKGLAALDCRTWGLSLVVAVLLGLSGAGVGYAAPGDLDPTFGTGGISITFGPQDTANALIQQADGKLVVAGFSNASASVCGPCDVLLVRYGPEGDSGPHLREWGDRDHGLRRRCSGQCAGVAA